MAKFTYKKTMDVPPELLEEIYHEFLCFLERNYGADLADALGVDEAAKRTYRSIAKETAEDIERMSR